MRHPAITFTLFLLILSSCHLGGGKSSDYPALLPMPEEVVWQDGGVVPLTKGHTIVLPSADDRNRILVEGLNADLSKAGLPTLELTPEYTYGSVVCTIDAKELTTPGAYTLSVKRGGIRITAADEDGIGYAIQTLRQLILPTGIPMVEIKDKPRLEYRGLMLDGSRHFFGVEEVKKLLDEMQRYKLNRLHWHLTDAGGWRLVIKSRPLLTERTAYRTESDWVKWWIEGDRRYAKEGTPGAYGGYYTQEQAREIVAYAAARGITVIPEIEMPGHSEEVLHAYPVLSCSGRARRGESDFCIGNPMSYQFLRDVLSEVYDIFPSAYIHLGGDEAGKQAWKSCPKCREVMRRAKLKDVDELQSYFIHRMGEMIEKDGRHFIGWDEILEGGLAPGAIVMSWRGMEGGLRAARSGHQVIMTPSPQCYLDYYQEDPLSVDYESNEGYCDLAQTYALDPVPEELTPEERALIHGVQGNMWTEYVKTNEALEYKIFPRLLAIAEIGWTPQEKRSWEDFRIRINRHIPMLHERDIQAYDLTNGLRPETEVDQDAGLTRIRWTTELDPCEMRYRVDGKVPEMSDPQIREDQTIEVRDSADIVVRQFRNGEPVGDPVTLRVDHHRAIGKPIRWETPVEGKYSGGGFETVLTDGYRGSVSFGDGRWYGNIVTPSNIGILDMGEETLINKVTTRCMHNTIPGIYAPEWVELSVSNDGEEWTVVDRIKSTLDPADRKLHFETFTFYTHTTCRYLRIQYEEAQRGQFLFADELVVW